MARDPPVCPNCDVKSQRIPGASGPEFVWRCPECAKRLDYCGVPSCENVIFQAELCRACADEMPSIYEVDPKTVQKATPDETDLRPPPKWRR